MCVLLMQLRNVSLAIQIFSCRQQAIRVIRSIQVLWKLWRWIVIRTLQTGLDSCSMMNFGFGFFVYVISITLAMFCVVANYIVRSRKKTSISSSQENGVSVQIAPPAVFVAEKQSSQARLMERLGTIPEADKRANRRRSRLSIGGDESGVHL